MKIVHCCLSCFYIDDFMYQENMLVREHVRLCHDVLVLTSTETFDDGGVLTYIDPSTYIGSDGATVKRLPYGGFLPSKLARKLRYHASVYEELLQFAPDVIMFHGMCSFELYTVSRYIAKHPNVVLYADSHEDFNNSATTFLSRTLLYRLFYVPVIRSSLKYISKVLYITYETKLFCNDVYGIDDELLEFFPLGGIVEKTDRYLSLRKDGRFEYLIDDNQTVFLQAGKFDAKKKLIESLRAFRKIKNENITFLIAGVLPAELDSAVRSLIEADDRVKFLGWVNSEKLHQLLCMCDVYLQPGSQSATMQMALSSRCAVVIDDVLSHRQMFCSNGALVSSQEELDTALFELSQSSEIIPKMQNNSYEYAKAYLDYGNLAQRLLR